METLKKHPKIELLDFQTGDWQSQKAFDITASWLTRFGDKIKGVWAANDDMGTGALALPLRASQERFPLSALMGSKRRSKPSRPANLSAR